MDDLIHRAAETYVDLLALGHASESGLHGRLVRSPATPRIYDANFVCDLTAGTPKQGAAFAAWLETARAERGTQQVLTGPATPEPAHAALALAGWQPKPTLQLVLTGGLQGPPPSPVPIRRVETEADRAQLENLMRSNSREQDTKAGTAIWTDVVCDEMAMSKRAKEPALRWWLASVDGKDVAYFSSWPGNNGVGIVEDLFTLPELRLRGVARALIHHSVADARARGAGPVLIGADPTDTPGRAYARLGFAPSFLTWGWLPREETS